MHYKYSQDFTKEFDAELCKYLCILEQGLNVTSPVCSDCMNSFSNERLPSCVEVDTGTC